jgi:hypothetical protein
MTFRNNLKTITLIAAMASWVLPTFTAEAGDVVNHKASKIVAVSAKAHRNLEHPGMCKVAWNAFPLILGISF